MSCIHLKKLYELCAKEEIKIGATDLVRLVCRQCGKQEVCPNLLLENYEATHGEEGKPLPAAGRDEARVSAT